MLTQFISSNDKWMCEMKANKTHSNKKQSIKNAVSSVEWQDLRQLTRGQIAYNLILPYPFLLLS